MEIRVSLTLNNGVHHHRILHDVYTVKSFYEKYNSFEHEVLTGDHYAHIIMAKDIEIFPIGYKEDYIKCLETFQCMVNIATPKIQAFMDDLLIHGKVLLFLEPISSVYFWIVGDFGTHLIPLSRCTDIDVFDRALKSIQTYSNGNRCSFYMVKPDKSSVIPVSNKYRFNGINKEEFKFITEQHIINEVM